MLQHCKSWFVQRWDSRWQRWERRERTSEQDQQSCWLSEEGGPSSSDNVTIWQWWYCFWSDLNSLQGWLDKYWHFVFMSPPPFHSFPAQKWKISHFCLNFEMWQIFLNKKHKSVGKIEVLFWTKKVEYRADSVTLPLLQLAKQVKIYKTFDILIFCIFTIIGEDEVRNYWTFRRVHSCPALDKLSGSVKI